MEQELTIDEGFRRMLRPLSRDEYEALERSIREQGCRDRIVVWEETNTLLDGHNRLEICQRHDIEYETYRVSLPDRAAALSWIAANQIARRNLTPQETAYLRGRHYLEARNPNGQHGNSCQGPTRERLADQYGVSERTIANDAQQAEALDRIAQTIGQAARDRILAGESKLRRQDLVRASQLPADEMRAAVEHGLRAKPKPAAKRQTPKPAPAIAPPAPGAATGPPSVDPPDEPGPISPQFRDSSVGITLADAKQRLERWLDGCLTQLPEEHHLEFAAELDSWAGLIRERCGVGV